MLFGLSCKQKPILLRLTLLGECVKGAFCYFVIHNCVVWIGRVRSKSVDWLHAAFGNSQIKIWNCSHFREVGEGIEPWSPQYQPKDLNCSLKSPEIRGAKGLSSHPYFSSSRRLIRSTASCHISCLDLLNDCFLDAINDVTDIIISYVWTCWEAETLYG